MQQIMRLVDFVCSFTALISVIFSLYVFLYLLFDISLPPKLQTTSLRSLFQQKIAAQFLFHCLSYGVHLNEWASDEDFRFLFRKIVVSV